MPAHLVFMSCQSIHAPNARRAGSQALRPASTRAWCRRCRWHHTADLFTNLSPSCSHTCCISASAAQPRLMCVGQSSAGDRRQAQPRASEIPGDLGRPDLMHANLETGIGRRNRTSRSLPSVHMCDQQSYDSLSTSTQSRAVELPSCAERSSI